MEVFKNCSHNIIHDVISLEGIQRANILNVYKSASQKLVPKITFQHTIDVFQMFQFS